MDNNTIASQESFEVLLLNWSFLLLLVTSIFFLLINRAERASRKIEEKLESDKIIKCENLDKMNFCNCDFTNSEFSNLSIQKTYFKSANLTNVVFKNVNLTGSDFSDAILTNTKFIDCVMTDVIIDKSKVKVLNPDWN